MKSINSRLEQIEESLRSQCPIKHTDEIAIGHTLQIFNSLFLIMKNGHKFGDQVTISEDSLIAFAFFLTSSDDMLYNFGYMQDKIKKFESFLATIYDNFCDVNIKFDKLITEIEHKTKKVGKWRRFIKTTIVYDGLYAFYYDSTNRAWPIKLFGNSLSRISDVDNKTHEIQIYRQSENTPFFSASLKNKDVDIEDILLIM